MQLGRACSPHRPHSPTGLWGIEGPLSPYPGRPLPTASLPDQSGSSSLDLRRRKSLLRGPQALPSPVPCSCAMGSSLWSPGPACPAHCPTEVP